MSVWLPLNPAPMPRTRVSITTASCSANATRSFEVHVIKGLPHADGLVVSYLPKERLLVYADMFNLPPADDPVPDPPVVGTMVFLDNIERLKLNVDQIMSVHSLNPDRLTSVADIRASLGR